MRAIDLRSWFVLSLLIARSALAADSPPSVSLYDPDPKHLWNHIHRALFVSVGTDGTQYGLDSSIFVGGRTSLLDDSSFPETRKLLVELATDRGSSLVRDPVRRAVLQHDLWTLFDAYTNPWGATSVEKKNLSALQQALARCIAKLSLTANDIQKLPNNYDLAVKSGAFSSEYDPQNRERAFLPPDLFNPAGPWVQIEPSEGERTTGPVHVEAVSGRSGFEVFIRLPGGRAETLAYLERLNLFEKPWNEATQIGTVSSTGQKERWAPRLNNETPQFPAGTMVALIRRMNLVSRDFVPTPSPVVQGVQIRIYREISRPADDAQAGAAKQDFYEFVLRRAKLFAGKEGGLHALAADEAEPQLMFHTIRETEQQRYGGHVALKTCMMCHNSPGIFSVNSYNRFNGVQVVNPQLLPASHPDTVRGQAAEWKRKQFNWGFLRSLLEADAK